MTLIGWHQTIEDAIKENNNPIKPLKDYYCENCKRKTEAESKTMFCRLPEFLIIHINRFIPIDVDNELVIQKDDRNVNYTTKGMKLECYGGIPSKIVNYDLQAIIFHHGENINHGHYTITTFGDTTIHINDEIITSDYIPNATPYILLYRIT
jgi:ubiquitin C-terminal hydrolase